MQRSLFLHIQSAVETHDPYFVQKINAVGTLGLSSLQKITAAMRRLAYGVAADYINEYNDLLYLPTTLVGMLLQSTTQSTVMTIQWVTISLMVYIQSGQHLEKQFHPHKVICKKKFVIAQESTKKDVEHAFGVLQARFVNVHGPVRFWKLNTLKNIMKACIIMHKMIVEDEQDVNGIKDFNYDAIDESSHAPVSHERMIELMKFIQGSSTIIP
ncbi:hypothetical protein HHK36_004803 [Tetracentron sinense]|uniref:Nuclease HARBI1 n=1 Tax=Tetracentron sinense TaxID=13715 RepID=A0A834ZN79_TETSI|nr:hypothetical protein HHK36_004803 [Tetracentron sinense]